MTNGFLLRFFGFLLLVPSVALGLAPFIIEQSAFASSMTDFSFHLGGTTVMSYESAIEQLYVTPFVWVTAALGELLLIARFLTHIQRKSQGVLTIY